MTGPQAERRYGVEIESRKQLYGLQRMEEAYGMRVAEWAQEGMPIEAMGTPSQMEAFRERKGTPVPWNVEERNEQSVQRSTEAAADTNPAGDAGVPESVRDVISSPGQSLDVSIQRAMEQRMDDSFGDVRVHAGPTAARACEQIDARAFTVGNHVAFNSGEYDPSSPEGQHVLAHELAHVRQQTGGAVSMLPKEDVELEIDPDPALEREAEETAQRVMAGGALGIQRLAETEVHVQRAANGGSMTYEGLDNLTEAVADLRETVSQNQQEIQNTRSDLSTLEDEVHTGLGEKAAGIAAGGAGAGTVALGRAGMEPAFQEALAESSMNPDLAAPALAAGLMAIGVGAAGTGAKGLWDRAKERFSRDETGEEEHVEAEDTDEKGNSRLGIF